MASAGSGAAGVRCAAPGAGTGAAGSHNYNYGHGGGGAGRGAAGQHAGYAAAQRAYLNQADVVDEVQPGAAAMPGTGAGMRGAGMGGGAGGPAGPGAGAGAGAGAGVGGGGDGGGGGSCYGARVASPAAAPVQTGVAGFPDGGDVLREMHDEMRRNPVQHRQYGPAGVLPVHGDTVTVHYETRYAGTNTLIESTYYHLRPRVFQVGANQVLPGLDSIVRTLWVGTKRQVYLDSASAYGSKGISGVVSPQANVLLVVELLKIEKHYATVCIIL